MLRRFHRRTMLIIENLLRGKNLVLEYSRFSHTRPVRFGRHPVRGGKERSAGRTKEKPFGGALGQLLFFKGHRRVSCR